MNHLSCLWYMYTEYQYSRTCLVRHLCKPFHCYPKFSFPFDHIFMGIFLHCVIWTPGLIRPTANFFSSANQARQVSLYLLVGPCNCVHEYNFNLTSFDHLIDIDLDENHNHDYFFSFILHKHSWHQKNCVWKMRWLHAF